MAVTAAFSSRNSRIGFQIPNTSNVYFLFARKWTVGVKVDELDVTTFEEFGFANFEDGIMEGDVSFDGFWDVRMHAAALQNSIQQSTLSPPVMYPGLVLSNANFFVKGANNPQGGVGGVSANPVGGNTLLTQAGAATYPSYQFPLLKLFTCNVDATVRGTLDVNFTAKAQGQFYLPGQGIGQTVSSFPNPRGVWY